MGVIEDINKYLKFLSTTSLTLEELNLYIMTVEEAKKAALPSKASWQVVTTGRGGETNKVRMVIDRFVESNGNGHHGGNNGVL
jgi:hypothetical protein